jgi:hypothetical protein
MQVKNCLMGDTFRFAITDIRQASRFFSFTAHRVLEFVVWIMRRLLVQDSEFLRQNVPDMEGPLLTQMQLPLLIEFAIFRSWLIG